jgi:hypothetical protein
LSWQNPHPVRVGRPIDAVLAEQLRAVVRERGMHRILRELHLSPAAIAGACAGSHVLSATEEAVRAYVESLVLPAGAQLHPGVVT